MNPFDYIDSINFNKNDIMITDDDEKSYDSFITNRALSYRPDATLFANEMNIHHKLDSRMQYDFLRLTISKRRIKKEKWMKAILPEDIEAVKEYYGYNNQRAKEALQLLNSEQIEQIKQVLFKGGKKKPQ